MRSIVRYLTAALALLCLAEITDLAWLSGVRATITTTASKVVAAGNGSTTQWNFSFVGVSTADLIVSVTNSSGVTTVLTLNTQYTVTFTPQTPNSVWSVGGFVTYPLSGPPLALGNTLTIQRQVPYTQTTPFQNQGQFLPQAVETAVDLLTMQAQQLNTLFTGALVEPATDSQPLAPLPAAAARANNALCFDSTGYIPLPCSVLPASSFLVSGTPSPGWVPIATSSTTAVWGTTFPALMTFDDGLQLGPLPFVQALDYTGGGSPSGVLGVRGSIISPVTDSLPVATFQSVANLSTGVAQTVYASIVKRGMAANVDYRAVWAECNDPVGGVNSSIACGRFSGALTGGSLGNGTAVTASFVCATSYAFCGATEGQLINNNADADTSFSASDFETAYLASNAGTKKSFAAWATNPNWTIPFINGVYIAVGTVQDSAFRSDATSVYGINLLNCTCIPFRSTDYEVDNSGNITSNSETTTALITASLLISKTAPTIGACGGGTPSIPINNGTAAFEVAVGSATQTCVINLPTASHHWLCYASNTTTNSTTVFLTKMVPGTLANNSVTLGNYTDIAGTGSNFGTGDVLAVHCDGD